MPRFKFLSALTIVLAVLLTRTSAHAFTIKCVRTLKPTHKISEVVFSPNGKLLAGVNRDAGTISVWQLKTGHLLYTLRTGTVITTPYSFGNYLGTILFTPDGNNIITTTSYYANATGDDGRNDPTANVPAQDKGKVQVWNVRTGQLVRTLFKGDTYTAAISPNGTTLAIIRDRLELWNTRTWERRSITPLSEGVSEIIFSPNSRLLIGGEYDNTLKFSLLCWRIWDAKTGKLLRYLKDADQESNVESFSTDSKFLNGTSRGETPTTVTLWSVRTGKKIHQLSVNEFNTFSPDAKLFVARNYTENSFMSGTIHHAVMQLCDTRTGIARRTLLKAPDIFNKRDDLLSSYGVQFSPNGNFLMVTVTQPGTKNRLLFFNGHTGARLRPNSPLSPGWFPVAFLSDRKSTVTLLATLNAAGAVQLWQMRQRFTLHHEQYRTNRHHSRI